MVTKKPVLLAILDGWGIGEETETNAVFMAKTPHMDQWLREYPNTTLLAHNGAVGLPDGQMGNSEVGHLNIGAGRVVYQDFTRINKAVAEGALAKNEILLKTLDKVLVQKSALHLLGLVSDGGVHSHLDHLLSLVATAAERGVERIFIHAFMDGRDTPPSSGVEYMTALVAGLATIGRGQVATISGRYYAMDRDNRWDRVKMTWDALVAGHGFASNEDPVTAMKSAYQRQETDEFIKPIVLQCAEKPIATVSDNDAVIFFNFRADRARELTRAFTLPGFDGFDVANRPRLSDYVMMTQYDKNFDLPSLFPPVALDHILGEEVSAAGLKQLRIAETEKYAHVTFFFNGGREAPYPGEDRVLIASPREVATYDQKPAMSAVEVTEALLAKLDSGLYDLVILNFANADMVGHTGILAAAIAACETVDSCLGRLVAKVKELSGTVLITADHGNSDIMLDTVTKVPYTAHTLNPVPFILINEELKGKHLHQGGALKDIAPTILRIIGLRIPEEMGGECLF
ncbi:MAG: 2,3-bisphosphoglycerate-independent phosphoglycerate mutase [Proteobacteria bacterium]|nr:2,3-bisphosphoglycerate-independent phosphoglycerate mutase [Pseudomonadota bacterium]MBU1639492.1 2,3-bisphosphoglycerate-independent phosphoglycerate mutase [Pseudomonadota bacterium]